MSHTVIVIQEEAILAASGRSGKKPQLQQLEIGMLHGFGDATQQRKTALSILKDRMDLSHVRLILPPSMCATKTVELPFVKGKALENLAERELDELRSPIRDYTVIQSAKKSGTTLCLGSVEKQILVQFLNLCEELSIGVDSVSIPMEAYERVLLQTKEAQEQTAIFLFFEEGGLTSVLCSEGKYVYSSRSRLFSEPGTYDYAAEIVRCVSGIVQFNSASKVQLNITNVYYAGYPESEFALSEDGIRAMGLETGPMPMPTGIQFAENDLSFEQLSSYFVCAGAMMQGNVRKHEEIDLLRAYRKEEASEEVEEKKVPLWQHAIPLAGTFAAGMVIFAGLFINNTVLQKKIDAKSEWMASSMVVSQYEESLSLQEKVTSLANAIHSVKLSNQNLETYPVLRQALVHEIEFVGGDKIMLTLNGYDADTGAFQFTANSAQVIDVPVYVRNLQDTGLFYSVSYSGYRFDEQDQVYTLKLDCTLLGNDIEGEPLTPIQQPEEESTETTEEAMP